MGFVSVNNNIRFLMEQNLNYLGEYTHINQIIKEHKIEEVIIAIETREHDKLERILNLLEANENLRIHVVPRHVRYFVGASSARILWRSIG